MRHNRKTPKLQRNKSHRDALLRNLAASLIEHRRITTTLAKAKALRPFAESLVTLGKKNDLHARQGGYCRIIKLGQRQSDAAPMALIEWVDALVTVGEAKAEA